ncbi:Tripartite tricarboxylate transporter family receptor [Rhodospirillales bacterium URHD0017]|nr:Tripartite tricarboxylate transporter family receptor [Rhodospirillales bacterium URHD0017]
MHRFHPVAPLPGARRRTYWTAHTTYPSTAGRGQRLGHRNDIAVGGIDIAAKATPDGYTLVMGESSNRAINPCLHKKLPFDPARDVAPVALVGTVPLVLVVSATAPFDSLKALVGTAKKKQLTFASSGNGTVSIWSARCGSAPSAATSCTCPTRARAR